MKNKKLSKWNLIWIFPEIAGEITLMGLIPMWLAKNLSNYHNVLSLEWMLSIGVMYLLFSQVTLRGFDRLKEVDWG